MAVEFATITEEERPHVDAIVQRAADMFREMGDPRPFYHIRMDIEATHAKVPLRLAELAQADDFNFWHDVAGIYRHLNRKTGKLDNRFRPRFTR